MDTKSGGQTENSTAAEISLLSCMKMATRSGGQAENYSTATEISLLSCMKMATRSGGQAENYSTATETSLPSCMPMGVGGRKTHFGAGGFSYSFDRNHGDVEVNPFVAGIKMLTALGCSNPLRNELPPPFTHKKNKDHPVKNKISRCVEGCVQRRTHSPPPPSEM
jgi:hypothetical protein